MKDTKKKCMIEDKTDDWCENLEEVQEDKRAEMKLRNRLYISLLVISLIPLFLCGVVMLYQNTQNVEHVIQENLLGVSQSQIDNIENFCEQIKQDLEIVSRYSFLQEEVKATLYPRDAEAETNRGYLEEILRERKSYQPYIQSIIIVNKNLVVVAGSEDYSASGALAFVEEEYLTGDFCIGNVYTRKTSFGMKRAVLVYQGVYYGDELIGFILQEVLTEHFNQYHENNVFWDNGVMQILDANDEIITVGGVGEEAADFIEQQELHERKVDRKRRVGGNEEYGSLEYSIGGEKYITRYASLKYTDWIIRVTANVDGYVHVGLSYLALFIAVLVIGVLLMTVLNYFITTRTIHPIEEIREVLKQVQQTQDYSLRIETGSDDELGELQHEINHLLQCVMESQMQGREEQKSLEKKAEKDPMTGVMNKKAIALRIEQMVEETKEKDGKLAVGFVDIDDFRDYNTKYGHAEGDHVIKYIAHTLREVIPGSVGRNGGDEFVFCMETDGREVVAQTMELLERKLATGIINGVTGERMPVPCSIGIVIDKAGRTDYRKLIQEADEAMYQAKGAGKNTYYIMVK